MARYAGKGWRSYSPAAATAMAPERARRAPEAVDVAAECLILGLDPGSLRTGFGLVRCTAGGESHVASGCIDVAGGDMVRRLRTIHQRITDLVEQHRPDMVAIEQVFVHRNPNSALKLGQARGVALCAAAGTGASVHEYAPRAIKQAVTGYGAADKAQIGHMVRLLLHIDAVIQADAADALAIALCHAQSRRLQARLGAQGLA